MTELLKRNNAILGRPKLFRSLCLRSVVTYHSNNTRRKNRQCSDIHLEHLFQTFVALYPRSSFLHYVVMSRYERNSFQNDFYTFVAFHPQLYPHQLRFKTIAQFEEMTIQKIISDLSKL